MTGHLRGDARKRQTDVHQIHPDPAVRDLIERERRAAAVEALREAAAWIAESIGYPIETAMPNHPMPQALWDALVEHVHADEMGKWHGNTLDHEGTELWLADEAGRS